MNQKNIEKYIQALKGNIYTNRISLVLYDGELDIYHYVYKIQRKTNECEMLSINYRQSKYYDITLPFIDQLDPYYGHCQILKEDPHIGQHIRVILNEIKKQELEEN